MSDYTPTTERVEHTYVTGMRQAFIASAGEHRQEFQRWLAEHDRKVLEAFAARVDDWDPLTFDDARQTLAAVIDAARAADPNSDVSERSGA
ncbi:MAG: hypothetical protein ACYC6C_13545 [Coriobacteriia bacterium]